MTDILVLDESYQRIADSLHQRLPGVGVICWSRDGELVRDGRRVDPGSIGPDVGWISADVLARGCIGEYVEALRGSHRLRWVQSANAGLDHEIYRTLAGQGVRLAKSGAQSIPIAEYVLAYVLDHFQDIDRRRADQLRKVWKPRRFRELWHTTWLVVGYGHIGRGVARRAKGFDCRVVAVRRSPQPDEHADVVAPLSALPELLPEADVVVLACPASEETRGLADARFFARMKQGAVLVNVARGALVDEAALLEGLDGGRPGHAVLDVFASEPLAADSPLWEHPQVVVTAHTSNAGDGTRGRGDELFVSNLERYVAGAPLVDEVDPGTLTG
jgi:phosphoglycerate dehydrogenase-like enzyme